MVISVAFGVHPTSDTYQIDLNSAFARVYRPVGAVFSVLIRPESLNPGWSWLGVRTNLTGTIQFTDPRATNFSKRFYRVSVP